MKKIITPIEYFDKTEQRNELDSVLIKSGKKPTGKVTILDNVKSTYDKYMWKHGTTNVVIVCNELEPQIYKVGIDEIQIINQPHIDTRPKHDYNPY